MKNQAVLLFDVDGVLVKPKAYRAGVVKTVELLCRQAEFPNIESLLPTEQDISYAESKGIHDPWDATNMFFALILIESQGNRGGTTKPDYRSLFDQLAAKVAEGVHAPDAFLASLKNSQRSKTLERYLRSTRDVYNNPGTRLFQNVVLGADAFKSTYGVQSNYSGSSLLRTLDEVLIKQETVLEILTLRKRAELLPAIYTGRPSGAPIAAAEQMRGYSPEAEMALELASMEALPMIAMGTMEWLARQKGVETEELTKPSTTHALAALICAVNGGDQLSALQQAYQITHGGGSIDDTTLAAWKQNGSAMNVFVVEDSPSGVRPFLELAPRFEQAGVKLNIRALGVSEDPEKSASLARVCEKVFSDVNLAAEYVLSNDC